MNRWSCAALAALAILGAGCGTDPVDCGAPPDIGGTWDVSGERTSDPAAVLSGTFEISAEGSCVVDGSYSMEADDGSAPNELLDGSIIGIFLDESTVDLTLREEAEGTERRFLGTISSDTIAGSWSATGEAGTLRLVRSTP